MGNEVSRPPQPEEETPPPGDPSRPSDVRVEVDVDLVEDICNTQGIDSDDYLVVRRDVQFSVTVHAREKVHIQSVLLIDAYSEGNTVRLSHVEDSSTRSGAEVQIGIPVDAPVGEYILQVNGRIENGGEFQTTLRRRVVVLFNAWSRNDGVYMEDASSRKEYVRNTKGRVYAGSVYGMPWNLALYRENTLKAVLLLLRKAPQLSFEQRRSPVFVSREMSAMVNVQDDAGVLVGNWSGRYEDGTAPSAWRGSAKILKQYLKSGGQPVRYGQCWVFSGVLLSVLRVLGIPSRSITNFSSAHDTNRNRTIDEYYNEDGEKISYLSSGSDSIWNFHVWNEVWTTRPDLPAGFGGWQVVDATPQEESPQGGGYRTGPAPIKAVKEGNSVVYDTNFVIAEVNADIKKYSVGADGVPRLVSVDTQSVGQDISTKAVGSNKRVDLTNSYKHREGSDLERRALYHGYEELMKEVHDMTFEIPEATYSFGEDVTLQVTMFNKAKQHTVKGSIVCEAVDYTGKVLREVQKLKVDKKVNKGKTESVSMTVQGVIFSEYPGNKVYLRFTVYLAVHGTGQVFSKEVSIAPEPPQLEVIAPAKLTLGTTSKGTVKFKNPLPVKMEKVVLTVEGDGLLRDDIENVVGTIEAGAEFSFSFDIHGLLPGEQQLVAGLDSDQVEMVSGEAEVLVVEGVEETDSPWQPEVEVLSVDLNLATNRRVHHTNRYSKQDLVLRRGQLFSVSLKLATPISGNKLVTRATFALLGDNYYRRPYSFEVVTVSKATGTTLNVEMKTPADVPVGSYKVVLTLDNGGKVTVVDHELRVVLLFNPWNSEDTCYFSTTSDLAEYVLSNKGRIWVGNSDSNYGRPWQFAQFTPQALDVALYFLSVMPKRDRANPIKVSRHLSAMVNSQDDNGILVGNWSGDYSGGVSPLRWTGSAEILAQFARTRKPVKYGQCWVFSGVLSTLLRCVGLPARSVSNFNSAHDTHFNRAIDKYFDENGEELSSGDSIWNFHVWNEAWMARPDLPAGFGGWQAVDATPQEESPQGGGYRLGPCPVRAVKLGQRMNYDVEFVISEVNADIRYYTLRPGGDPYLTRVNRRHVGKNISTKAVGNNAVNDITDEYKFREGSMGERAALLADDEDKRELDVSISSTKNVLIGQPFTVVATVTNKTGAVHDYRMNLRGRTMLYTGITGQVVKKLRENIRLQAGQSTTVEMRVLPFDYLKLLEGGNFMQFVAMVIADDDTSAVDTYSLRLKTPDIDISLPADGLKLYHPATLEVSFRNPLDKVLYDGEFQLLGEGHVQDATVGVPSVPPQGIAKATITTIPVVAGPVELVVRFSSNRLTDIMGDVDTRVTK